jgi:hypothetical protein
MTELAGRDPAANAEMLSSNREALAGWLDRVSFALGELRERLDDPAALRSLLDDAWEARERWVRSQPNVRPGEDSYHGSNTDIDVRTGISGLFLGRRPSRDRGKRR